MLVQIVQKYYLSLSNMQICDVLFAVVVVVAYGNSFGLFYWLRVKNSNHLHTELSLGYLKDSKFYRESKAFFIHISSIASFKPFLIVWWWEYCTFSDSSVVSFESSPWPKYTQYETIFPKKSCSTIKPFSFFKYVIC